MSNHKILEAARLFDRAVTGDYRAKADLRESLTTSDFPSLLGSALNIKLASAYATMPSVWQQYADRVTVPNFKPQRVGALVENFDLELVPEATEYPAGDFDDRMVEFTIGKFGKRIPLTWEMVINDELGIFRNIDQGLGRAARQTEDKATAHALLAPNLSGVNTAFFKAANGNAPESAALSAKALQDALEVLGQKKDANGHVMVRPRTVLVVPPTLEWKAREILTASEIRTVDGQTTRVSANPLANSVDLVVEPRLLDNTVSNAATTWFLLPAPRSARPALVTGFLAGHEQPDLRVKNDQGTRPGGGSIPEREGSFDDDTIQYRVRHVTGSTLLFPEFTFVSRGA